MFYEKINKRLFDIPKINNIFNDILTWSGTIEQHKLSLDQILQRLQDCCLSLQTFKCVFDKLCAQFLGAIAKKEGLLSPGPEKVRDIKTTN